MSFKILGIDKDNNSIVVDWLDGQIYNHAIPLYILENPSLSKEEICEHIEYMRPPAIPQYVLSTALHDLVEPAEGANEEEEIALDNLLSISSVLEFRDRFTVSEQVAIREAQKTDTEVGIVYDNFLAAQYIDVRDKRVREGINIYYAKELIEEHRIEEILAKKDAPLEEE